MIIDLHLDLSMNAMEWNRDLRLPVDVINAREAGMADKPDRGRATVSLDALRAGGVGLVVATQIARYVEPGSSLPGWSSPEQAWAQTQAQLAWYRAMEEQGLMRMVVSREELGVWGSERVEGLGLRVEGLGFRVEDLAESREQLVESREPILYVLSLEGADSLVDLSYLERAYGYGLRAIGPAHYGLGRYVNGTNATGAMGKPGIDLLKKMDELGMILDATHLCDDAFWQAMDLYHGPVWASHNNCRTLVPHNRQYSDEQIKVLLQRGAVIGAAMDAWMIVPGWERGRSTPENMGCTLERVVDHIDHICDLAGNSLHVSIGSDLDGGFGREQCPSDIETIADLNKLPAILRGRGYTALDVENIMYGNALRFLRCHLPSVQA